MLAVSLAVGKDRQSVRAMAYVLVAPRVGALVYGMAEKKVVLKVSIVVGRKVAKSVD